MSFLDQSRPLACDPDLGHDLCSDRTESEVTKVQGGIK